MMPEMSPLNAFFWGGEDYPCFFLQKGNIISVTCIYTYIQKISKKAKEW